MDEDLVHALILTGNEEDRLETFPACEYTRVALKQGLAIDAPVTCLQCSTLIVQCDTIIDYNNADLWRFYRSQIAQKHDAAIQRRDESARRKKERQAEEERWAREDAKRREEEAERNRKEFEELREVNRIAEERRLRMITTVFGTKESVVRVYNGHAFVEEALPRTFCEFERNLIEPLTPEKVAVLLRKATTQYENITCDACHRGLRIRAAWLYLL